MPSRYPGSWRLWLVVATFAVLAAALFASTRARPPVIFAAGFGFVMGIVVHLAAEALNVERRWPIVAVAALLVGVGFASSFGLSYRKHAAEWERRLGEAPTDPIAIALLNQAPDNAVVLEVPKYSFDRYLAQRQPTWPQPWPLVVLVGDWITAMLVAGVVMCAGSKVKEPEALVRDVDSSSLAGAAGFREESQSERSPPLPNPLPRGGGEGT